MGKESKIAWTQASQNFWTGCKKVSAGCKHCYMFRDMRRWGKDPEEVTRTSEGTFNAPLKWKEPRVIFTCSWSDYFIDSADAWREDAWSIIRRTPQHVWLLLTKRPENIASRLPGDWEGGRNYPNVWLGVTIEEPRVLGRIEILRRTNHPNLFISLEPLLLPPIIKHDVEIFRKTFAGIKWMIAGGESGYYARPCFIEFFEHIIDYGKTLGIPIFIKQTGSYMAKESGYKHSAGADPAEWPEFLRVQEYPPEILKLITGANMGPRGKDGGMGTLFDEPIKKP